MVKNILIYILMLGMFSSKGICHKELEEGDTSRVSSLRRLCGTRLAQTIEQESRESNYTTITQTSNIFGPQLAQELLFGAWYRPSFPLDVRLMGFMPSVDLTTPKSNALIKYFEENPNGFRALAQSQPCNIKELYIGGGYLDSTRLRSHVSALQFLTGLEILGVSMNDLGSNVRFLQPLTKLRVLKVGYNNLGEYVSALRALTGVKILDISNNKLGHHVSALRALTGVEILDISNNNLDHHISALRSLTRVENLNITNNDLGHHVSALQTLTGLRTLLIWGNYLREHVSALQSFTNLIELNVMDNELGEHVSALQPLTNLRSLNAGFNKHGSPLGLLQSSSIPNMVRGSSAK